MWELLEFEHVKIVLTRKQVPKNKIHAAYKIHALANKIHAINHHNSLIIFSTAAKSYILNYMWTLHELVALNLHQENPSSLQHFNFCNFTLWMPRAVAKDDHGAGVPEFAF